MFNKTIVKLIRLIVTIYILAVFVAIPAGALIYDSFAASSLYLRNQIPATIRRDAPMVATLAKELRMLSDDPHILAGMVKELAWSRIDVSTDDTWSQTSGLTSTLAEMVERKEKNRWPQFRGDCDEQAVLMSCLLEALGITWRIDHSPLLSHAWVVVTINGHDFSLNSEVNPPSPLSIGCRLWGIFAVRTPPAIPANLSHIHTQSLERLGTTPIRFSTSL